MPKHTPQRPNQPKAGDRPVPTKYRFMKVGTMIFTPTAAQRAQIALGYNIQITQQIRMQHNAGALDVDTRMDVTAQNDFKGLPTVGHIEEKPVITPAKGGGE